MTKEEIEALLELEKAYGSDAMQSAAPAIARTALDALAEVERLREENGRLRAMFRVNMLRLVSDISHADIDILLDGDARAAIGDKGDEE